MEALKYLQDRGIVHRDIKPQNVFLDGNNEAKLGDFGLARIVDKDQDEVHRKADQKVKLRESFGHHSGDVTNALGTYRFAAPEQLANKGRYGLKVDNFSCGTVLLEMFRDINCTDMMMNAIYRAVRNEGKVHDSLIS